MPLRPMLQHSERNYLAEKVLFTAGYPNFLQKGIAGKKARIDTLSGLYFWLSGGCIKEKQRLLAPMLESIRL